MGGAEAGWKAREERRGGAEASEEVVGVDRAEGGGRRRNGGQWLQIESRWSVRRALFILGSSVVTALPSSDLAFPLPPPKQPNHARFRSLGAPQVPLPRSRMLCNPRPAINHLPPPISQTRHNSSQDIPTTNLIPLLITASVPSPPTSRRSSFHFHFQQSPPPPSAPHSDPAPLLSPRPRPGLGRTRRPRPTSPRPRPRPASCAPPQPGCPPTAPRTMRVWAREAAGGGWMHSGSTRTTPEDALSPGMGILLAPG